MPERKNVGDEPPAAEAEANEEPARIRRRHFIYYMTEGTNEIVRLEEYNEETGETQELRLVAEPPGEASSELSTDEYEESYYASGQNPYGYSWPAPYSYGGSPHGLLLWIAPAPPPFESPYSGRTSAGSFPAGRRTLRSAESERGIGPPKAGRMRFPDLGLSIPPPKAGSLRFHEIGIGPPKAGSKFAAIGPPKAGTETFAGEVGIGPPKSGPQNLTGSGGIGPPKAGKETAVTPIGPPKAGKETAVEDAAIGPPKAGANRTLTDEAPSRLRRGGREGGGRVSPTRRKPKP